METKKIKMNELRNIVKQIIMEEAMTPEESLGSVELNMQDIIFISISLDAYPFEKSARFLQTVNKVHSLLKNKKK